MSGHVVVLNGGSSAGKTTLCRALQATLPDIWFRAGIDAFLGSSSVRLYEHPQGLEIASDGTVLRGTEFDRLYDAYRAGVAAFAAAGANVILDEVMLRGEPDQRAWRQAFGTEPLWIGIRCQPDEAERRELGRGDRDRGMARGQADTVHEGVAYDLELDMTARPTAEAVPPIAAAIRDRWPA